MHHPSGRKVRDDKGSLRLSADQYQLAVFGLVNNRGASTRLLHRTLQRACGLRISEATLRRFRDRLQADPRTRLMFTDADRRKEYLRTYAGQVFAAHANELWQLDMTRCDILVWDPETARVVRPRVHAIIDVYSGCIVSVLFSEREDQAQTDAVIGGALIAKPAPFTDAWPVFGTPTRLYMDNGKTYRSGHVHRYLGELGVEVVHSRPLVSHTRGKIERFFGTLHGYEKTMPGYCGANAKERATEEIRRLTRNTLAWVARGGERDPGWGERLLTLDEFRDRAVAAILSDYHDTVVGNKSRLEHFLETAPAKTQRLYSQEDLVLTLARRTARTVNPDGSIRFGNRFWTVESGELANYVALEVLVLTNPALPEVPYLIAWQPKNGGLEIVGRAVLIPDRADSDEARALRANSKAAKKRELQRQTQQKRELLNPHLAIPNMQLEQVQAELNIAPLPPVALPKARLEALRGAPAADDADDPFPEFGLEPELRGETIDDIFRELRKNR